MSRLPETLQSPEYLDPAEAAEWLPYTFYFSQGNDLLQKKIFIYLKHRKPTQIARPDFQREMRRQVGPEVVRLAKSELHTQEDIDKNDFPRILNRALEDWEWVLHEPGKPIADERYNEFLDEILTGILKRDHKNLIEKGGRSVPGPLGDNQLSHFTHYVVLFGKVVRNQDSEFELLNLPSIFLEMIAELHVRIKALVTIEKREGFLSIEQKEILTSARKILKVYNQHHPDTKVELDDLLK